MCDFNNLSDEEKSKYHQLLTDTANIFGGINNFLQLLEAIRDRKPHPIIASECLFRFSQGSITWGKVVFNDKLALLLKSRINESKQGNFLPHKDSKQYKKVLNLVRTLSPIVFEVTLKDESSFSMHPFDKIDDDVTMLNPIFDAIFFCSVNTVKKILTYEKRD